jgi:hypothetical protein
MKRCTKCDTEKPLDQFRREKNGRVVGGYCKTCKSVCDREQKLRKPYGVGRETYEAFLLDQGGACAICGHVVSGASLSLDHCHLTGEPRGLLCSDCNFGLGFFKDDIDRLRAAISYMEKREAPAMRAIRTARRCSTR